MAKQFKKALCIFRRDLRLDDNTGLLHAQTLSDKVIPCFIIDPRQVGADNRYRSMNAIQFMTEAIDDLGKQLKAQGGKLYVCYGNAEDVIAQWLKNESIDAIFLNRDYTLFSIKRDETIKKLCIKYGVAFYNDYDLLLNEPESVLTMNQTPYTIFTPYAKRARQLPVRKPQKKRMKNWYRKSVSIVDEKKLATLKKQYDNKQLHVHGVRADALNILKILKRFDDYTKTHDFPSISTTNLSAYIKFGLVSIREVYHAIVKKLGPNHPLLRQLYWRDFFTQIAYFSPFVFGQSFKEKYKALIWKNSKKLFDLWCTGKTGFPIVDAGMRQLNATGYMHNRVRMIVGSFLVKDLAIDWRWGEQYFAQQLVDYDPSVNNGNWQWVASTGADAQPYFRIFNPWLQQKKFDPDCTYIKHWVPELTDFEPKIIHMWFNQDMPNVSYPRPCVDHKKAAAAAKARYRNVR